MRFATVDLGTNTVLLLVAEAGEGGALRPVYEEERFVRLGEGVDASRTLSEPAIGRVLAALTDYAATAGEHGARIVAAGATSATRDAANQSSFLARVRAETGVALEVLSGRDEALWSFRGACSAFPGLEAACVFDVGGGSTELVAGPTAGDPPRRVSLDVGAVRLTERHFPALPPGPEAVARAEAMVGGLLATADGLGRGLPLVGAAGTVTALAHLASPDDPARPIPAAEVRAWRDRLLAMTADEVRALDPPRLAGRADVFAAGVLIVDAVLRHLGAEAVRPSPRDLRHGLALRWLKERGGPPPPFAPVPPLPMPWADDRIARSGDEDPGPPIHHSSNHPLAMTPEQVLDALRHVIEPDLGRDLVSLDMVQDVAVDGRRVSFTVVLTTPACPLQERIRSECVAAVQEHLGRDVEVTVNLTSNVTTRQGPPAGPGAMPPQAESGSSRVKNIIAVASGKGGVGKSTVAVNLAIALARSGAAVGLADTDIYGPSIPLMLGVPESEKPRVNEDRKIEPLERHGVKLLSMGFLVDPTHAVVWRGPMVSSAVRQFLNDAAWGELDYLVLDLPPGTGDIQLTIVQTVALTGAVIVSTPQAVALADAKKGVAMFKNVHVPVLGIVENMAYFTPPDLPDRKYHLFGEGGARRLAEELQVPFLGEVPIEQAVREGGDRGAPVVVAAPESAAARALTGVAERTAQQVSIRNAEAAPTQKVEILYR